MPKVVCKWLPPDQRAPKRCARCQQTKPLTREYWSPGKGKRYGLSDGWCRKCIAAYTKVRNQEDRINAMLAYSNNSPACACCGEDRFLFLTIDHIHGNGNQHRLEVTGSKRGNITAWLRKNNYPPGFQVLCFNCNMGRAANRGECPYRMSHGRAMNATRRSA